MPLLPIKRFPISVFVIKKFYSQKQKVDEEGEFIVDPYSVVNKSKCLFYLIAIQI